MIIHRVSAGESSYDIAAKYSVPQTKLIADNMAREQLAVGEELIVIKPTRTALVGAKDTRTSISKRYGITENALLTANPNIIRGGVRPGQILAVKQENLSLGAATAIGLTAASYLTEGLATALPYLTYVTVSCIELQGGALRYIFDPSDICRIARREKKQLLLGVSDKEGGASLNADGMLDSLKEACRAYQADGILLFARDAAASDPDKYCEFILKLRRGFIGSELLFFTALYKDTPPLAAELSDGAVCLADDMRKDELNSLKELAELAESSKIFVKLHTEANIGGKAFALSDIAQLCHRRASHLVNDSSLFTHLAYRLYRGGVGEDVDIAFPSLEYTKAKLLLMSELGYAGIFIDTDRLDIRRLTMFNASFVRADYDLTYRYISSP